VKTTFVIGILTTIMLLGSPASRADTGPAAARDTVPPVTQPILTAWQEGDKARAISDFCNADWHARPIFAPGLALSLSEAQLKTLPEEDRALKSREIPAQLDLLKQLATAVAQAGREAAALGDTNQAGKCFGSLKACGSALNRPEYLRLVQQTGQVMKRMGELALARLGK
jgi:hypothetical protein